MLVCAGIGLVGGMLGAFVGNSLLREVQRQHVDAGSRLDPRRRPHRRVHRRLRHAAGADGQERFAASRSRRRSTASTAASSAASSAACRSGCCCENASIPVSNLTIGLVILGLCIGLFIPLAQVVLKEAWVKVEAGFRPGREIMLSKDETLIGKAESCDIGLFGGQGLEKQHARIILKNGQYFLADLDTPGGTYRQRPARPQADAAARRRRDSRRQLRPPLRRTRNEKRRQVPACGYSGTRR